MKINLVGGIFGMPAEFREIGLQETTETLLADGLRARGHQVFTYGHHDWIPTRGRDIIHVHHLGRGCVQLLGRRKLPPYVFTRHATKAIPRTQAAVLDRTYSKADSIIALSDLERVMLEGQGVPQGKVSRIYNGISDRPFNAMLRRRPQEGSPWRLLCVGQLVELKRVHFALELMQYLDLRNIHVQLDIVYQRDTLLSELKSLARVLDVSHLVNFVGPLDRRDIGDLMRKSHILVHPSRTEALPTVIAEAALTGLPVFAFDVGGIREQVAQPSQLLSVNDREGMMRMVAHILEEYEREAAKAFAHSDRARAQYDLETMILAHESLYMAALERRQEQH